MMIKEALYISKECYQREREECATELKTLTARLKELDKVLAAVGVLLPLYDPDYRGTTAQSLQPDTVTAPTKSQGSRTGRPQKQIPDVAGLKTSGKSLRELAKEVGVHPATLSRRFRGAGEAV